MENLRKKTEEIQMAKRELEDKIYNIANEFTEKTGVTINSIKVVNVYSTVSGNVYRVGEIKITCEV